eukprot:10352212-Alexandrium_andersonii.AAC.1
MRLRPRLGRAPRQSDSPMRAATLAVASAAHPTRLQPSRCVRKATREPGRCCGGGDRCSSPNGARVRR